MRAKPCQRGSPCTVADNRVVLDVCPRVLDSPIVVARDEDGGVVAHFSQFRPELLKACAGGVTATAAA